MPSGACSRPVLEVFRSDGAHLIFEGGDPSRGSYRRERMGAEPDCELIFPGASSSPFSRRRPFPINQMVPASQSATGADKNSRRGRVGVTSGQKWVAIEKAMAESAAPMAANFRAKNMLKTVTKVRSRKLGVFMLSRYQTRRCGRSFFPILGGGTHFPSARNAASVSWSGMAGESDFSGKSWFPIDHGEFTAIV